MSSMMQVGAYSTRSEAEIAQAALAAAGIPSMLEADDAGGAYPFDLSGAARLLVDERDAEEAASVLAGPSHEDREEA
jgi:Putative prokaryotic signal transducing protein